MDKRSRSFSKEHRKALSESAKKRHRRGDKFGFQKGNDYWKMNLGPRKIKHKAGYILIRKPDHPDANNGRIFEHRYVMEKNLGRYLERDEVVHHKNEKKDDNRPENLEIMKKREHDRMETVKRWKEGNFRGQKSDCYPKN